MLNKTIIWKQKGGFFNKLRVYSAIQNMKIENIKFIILDEPDLELNDYFFDYIKNNFNIKFDKINSLNEINDLKDNFFCLNEYNFNYYFNHLDLLNLFSQKYLYIEIGVRYKNYSFPKLSDTLNIKLDNEDFEIKNKLLKYDNIISLRSAPHEFNIYQYYSNKLCFHTIESSNLYALQWRNFYRIDLNSYMINYIKSHKNYVLLLDFTNENINDLLEKNQINYLNIYEKNNRSKNGINDYLKKYYILNNIQGKVNIYFSNYSSNTAVPSAKIIQLHHVLKHKININIAPEHLNSNYINDKNRKYDIYLTEDTNKNYDSIFNSIDIFNNLVTNFSYKIAIETFMNCDNIKNKNIIKLNDEWQQPIATEYYAYLQLRHFNLDHKYIAYPWANMIDNYTHNKNIKKLKQFPYSSLYLDDIQKLKDMKLSNCVTVIQHISYEKIIPFFQSIGIKYVFASHCLKEKIILGVKIFPFFLYCNIYDIEPTINNDLLCNGIYGINTNKKRNDIINMLNKSKFVDLKTNNSWFFQEFVYDLQIRKKKIDTTNLFRENKEYIKHLAQSSFQFCLGGSGKNTIRLFECIKLKIVPIIDFDIEYNSSIFRFEDYVIKIDYEDLSKHLENYDLDTYKINNFYLTDLIKLKKKYIQRDYKYINNLDLYSYYIREKLYNFTTSDKSEDIMNINRLIYKKNINQIYISDSIKNNLESKIPILSNKYDVNAPMLFIGMYTYKDFEKFSSHLGKKYIIWCNKDCEYSNKKRRYMIYKIKNDITDSYYYYDFCKMNLDLLEINSNKVILDINSPLLFDDINDKINQIIISNDINKDIKSKLPKSSNKNDIFSPTIFIGMYNANDFLKFQSHIGQKSIIWCGNDCDYNNKNRQILINKIKNDIYSNYYFNEDCKNNLDLFEISSTKIRL